MFLINLSRYFLTLFGLSFLRVVQGLGEEGGGGGGVPAAYNSKPINDNEMKFGEVVHNDKSLNLV